MGSILQNIQEKKTTLLPRNHSLPVSQPDPSKAADQPGGGIRRRLSALSLRIQPISSSSSSSTSWRFPRSKSLSSIGEHASTSIRSWWGWGWGWILSKKPGFAEDLEMNEEEKHVLGSWSKGSLRHVFYKVRAELRKLWRSDNGGRLPMTFRYDSSNYNKNFDDGLNGC
ncbi:hypothetical protein Dimus_025916 [Dionaea muscipula]